MTDDLPGPSVDTRGRTLSTISDQLERLMTRVADDVARYAGAKVGPTGGGFVIYYLTDDSGEPLKTSNAGDHGISLADIESTAGYRHLQTYCADFPLSLRLDEHSYADTPQTPKYSRETETAA